MSQRKRRSAQFKFKVALEAAKEAETLNQLSCIPVRSVNGSTTCSTRVPVYSASRHHGSSKSRKRSVLPIFAVSWSSEWGQPHARLHLVYDRA